MYNMEQIREIIDATPPDLKGQALEIIKARAVAIGRKLDKDAHAWNIVYAVPLYGRTVYCVSKRGIIQ